MQEYKGQETNSNELDEPDAAMYCDSSRKEVDHRFDSVGESDITIVQAGVWSYVSMGNRQFEWSITSEESQS